MGTTFSSDGKMVNLRQIKKKYSQRLYILIYNNFAFPSKVRFISLFYENNENFNI